MNKNTCVNISRVRARLTSPEKAVDNVVRHAEVSEKVIERYLVERAKHLGLPCLKYANANMTGYPDRLIVLPDGKVVWVELKSRGRKPSKIQQLRHAELEAIGHTVLVIDSKGGVDDFINRISHEI